MVPGFPKFHMKLPDGPKGGFPLRLNKCYAKPLQCVKAWPGGPLQSMTIGMCAAGPQVIPAAHAAAQ